MSNYLKKLIILYHYIIRSFILIVLSVTLGCNFFGKGKIKVSGMLIGIGIGIGYVISLFWGDMISFENVKNSSWVAFPQFFKWGIEFHPSAIISMILMYIVQAVQTIGDVSSTAIGGFNREATDKEIGGAIKGQGICGMLGACIGGLPTDPYSQNVGLIATTKVVVKRVFTIVGVIMVVAAITMSGIQLISQQPLNYRNKMIVGIALALGVGISTVSNSLQFFPVAVQNIIGKSPIVLSFTIAFILNIIVPVDNSKED